MSTSASAARVGGGDEEQAAYLGELYRRQLELRPDEYLALHASARFLAGTVAVHRFYRGWLPARGRVLDWGCRHAPDACLLRARYGAGLEIDGCDVHDGTEYPVFFQAAGLRYTRLTHTWLLPYEDRSFDAVVASGVLEHAAMDYESLKELRRVLKPGGRLVVSYLPNRYSVEEALLRWRRPGEAHRRLYSRGELRGLLQRAGLQPLCCGYQTRLDLLEAEGAAGLVRPIARAMGLPRLTSCLCAVAEAVDSF